MTNEEPPPIRATRGFFFPSKPSIHNRSPNLSCHLTLASARPKVQAVELLRLENATIGYDEALLSSIHLAVCSGERLAVLGPNGGGKSTLLKSLIGLVPLVSGQCVYASGNSPRVGYVPQAHRADPLFPLTAWDVVLQGRYGLIGLGRRVRARDREFARAQLSKVGMADKSQQLFRSLSGGQRQRVLLARALCGEPELLVLDEFTSDMDPAAAAALLSEVSLLAKESRTSVVFVTHEITAAASHATHVAMVDARRGFFQRGAADEMLTDERLSQLYGQKVHVERRDGRTGVFVESGDAS